MSVKMITAVWACEALRGTDLLLMLALADFADDDGQCYPRQATVAAKTRVHRNTVQRRMKDLEADGFITVDRTRNATGGASRYFLTLPQNGVGSADLTSKWCEAHTTGGVSLPTPVVSEEPSKNHQRTYALTRAASRRATPEEAQRAAVEMGLPWLCHETRQWRKPGDAEYLVSIEGGVKSSQEKHTSVEVRICDLPFSPRVNNALINAGFRTLGDLVGSTQAEILRHQDIGRGSLNEIISVVEAAGWRIGDAFPLDGTADASEQEAGTGAAEVGRADET